MILKIPSIAALMAASSSSTVVLPKSTLHPMYVGFPVRRATIFAVRVAKSILVGIE